jgi:hypothetical protein
MELPAIMKWIKQTFAQRYNRLMGWIGHIWGDRYWSRILEGEPPEDAGAEAACGAGSGGRVGRSRGQSETPDTGVRPWRRKRGRGPRFSASPPRPGLFPSG